MNHNKLNSAKADKEVPADGRNSKRALTQPRIPEYNVERLRSAAKAMYYENISCKAAAKQFDVTIVDLKHYYNNNTEDYMDDDNENDLNDF